ncbi:MAG: hypothetical protein ABII82_04865 [Verrucomicrobiota bacterium]
MPSHLLSVCLATLLCVASARAGLIESQVSFTASYDELLAGGGRVWACRYDPTPASRLVGEAGALVDEAEVALPARTLRAAVSPDGVFYAVTTGTETNINPSAHLWEKPPGGAWTNVGQIRSTSYSRRVSSAEFGFVERLVVVNLQTQHSSFGGGGTGTVIVTDPVGGSTNPALALFDRDARSLSFGPAGFATIRGAGPLYGLKSEIVFGYFSMDRLVASTDGLNWSKVNVPTQPMNDVVTLLAVGDQFPLGINGERLFFGDILSSTSLAVVNAGNRPMKYRLPFQENGHGPADATTPPGQRYNTAQLNGMATLHAGEVFFGFYRQTSQEGGADRQLMVCSTDYLQTFEFHVYSDNGYIDAVTDGEACHVLRATGTGTTLLRLTPDGPRVPVGQRPRLRAAGRTQAFPTGLARIDPNTGEPVPSTLDRRVIDLEVMSEDGVFFVLETSTDLENWTPIGLPFPAGQTATFVLPPEEPRRFFR